MDQELTDIEQNLLLLVFSYIQKSYDKLDCGHLFHTLEGCGAIPKMWGVLDELWENKEVVTRHNRYHGPQLRETSGTTQGGLALPTLLNVAFDNVVYHWLSLTVEYGVTIHDGMRHAVGQSLGVFYVDDGIPGSQDLEWLQGDFNLLIGLFERIGLSSKIAKSKNMTCQLIEILLAMSEVAFGRSITGEGSTY